LLLLKQAETLALRQRQAAIKASEIILKKKKTTEQINGDLKET
jgi:hypothetical protein